LVALSVSAKSALDYSKSNRDCSLSTHRLTISPLLFNNSEFEFIVVVIELFSKYISFCTIPSAHIKLYGCIIENVSVKILILLLSVK